MKDTDRRQPDLFDLIHAFVTASLEGELTADEVKYMERLLSHSAEARRLYTQYIDTTVRLPRALALLELAKQTSKAIPHRRPPWCRHRRPSNRLFSGFLAILVGVRGAS